MDLNSRKKIIPLINQIQTVVYEHRWLILIIVIYAGIAWGVHTHLFMHYKRPLIFDGFATSMLLVGSIFIFSCYAIYVMVFIRPHRLTQFLRRNLQPYLTTERLLHSLPVVILFPIFASSFTIFKAAIPLIHPYSWDKRLAEWDLILHGGVHPWQWLGPLFAFPLVTFTINFFYHLWFFVLYVVLYYLAFSMRHPKLRMQFLINFVLSWIIFGTVFSTIFSSLGPCYYGYLFPDKNPYSELMTYLNEANQYAPIWALDVQQMLWDGFNDKKQIYLLGISAMPSMHVATAVLLALWGWKTNTTLGIASTLFAAIIMIGSVHLGWHYALDGYVGGIGTYAIWHGVGWLLNQPAPYAAVNSSFQEDLMINSTSHR